LLVLAIFQKACEEKYPKHLCVILKRIILHVLSNSSNSRDNKVVQYEIFLLLLLYSEASLQSYDYGTAIARAKEALGSTASSHTDTFFAHLQLCRAYAVQGDLLNSRNEYMKCLQIHTNTEIGWVMLKHMEPVCSLEGSSGEIENNLQDCVERNGSDPLKWASLFSLSAQCFIWDEDFASAEKALALACTEGDTDSCILFLNGKPLSSPITRVTVICSLKTVCYLLNEVALQT
jgi:superkiller protein 3